MYISASFDDCSSCHSAFSEGIYSLESCDFDHAEACFLQALSTIDQQHKFYSRYISYYGMTRVMKGDSDSVRWCRAAISNDALDGDLYLNLARVEWFLNNRRNAVLALMEGQKRDVKHEGLVRMWLRIGERKSKPVFFLPRGNLVNKALGYVLRR